MIFTTTFLQYSHMLWEGFCKLRTEWRMEKCGWWNADGKMRMTKCGWNIMYDNMRMIKYLWSEMNWTCFLTVLLVDNPGHVIGFRPREVQYLFYSITNMIKTLLPGSHKRKKETKSWSNNDDSTSDYVLLSLLHRKAVILSTPKTDINKLNAATATDRAPQMTLVEKFAMQRPADNGS